MSRKSLFFGSIVLILAMLFALAGCKDPVAGPQGPQGDQGNQGDKGDSIQGGTGDTGAGGLSGDDIRAVDLDDAFAKSDVVTLLSNVQTVYGKVPSGGTLRVLGEAITVPAERTLELENGATLIIYQGATLSAIAVPGTEGSLVAGTGAKVEGEGAVILPVDLSDPDDPLDEPFPASLLHWESDQVTIPLKYRYPGSYYDGSDILDLNSSAIAAIFGKENGTKYTELTVKNVTALGANAIPANKKLTLVGSFNTIVVPFMLINYAKLTVGEQGVLTVTGTGALSSNSAAEFVNEGEVSLDVNVSLTGNSGGLTNNGTIYTQSVTGSTIVALLGITATEATKTATIVVRNVGSGTPIVLTGAGGVSIPLNQNLKLLPIGVTVQTYTLADAPEPFTGFGLEGKPVITIGPTAILNLPANVTTIGTTVVNRSGGLISTATVSSATLKNIFTNMGGIGRVTATAAVQLTSDLAFAIPKDTVLTLGNVGATLATGTDSSLTIDGTLINGGNAPLAPLDNITINGTVDLGTAGLTIAALKTLKISSSAVISGAGVLEQEDATSVVEIDGLPGYVLTNTGVVGDNFATALANITETRDKLKDTVSLGGSQFAGFSEKAIGTVDLSGDAANTILPIAFSATAAGDPIIIPGTTAITPTALAVLGDTPPFTTSTTFTLSINGSRELSLADSGLTGSTDKFGVLEFNKYTITELLLQSPELGGEDYLFHLGVKSKR
jgi:hypothetical protein